MRFSPPSTCFQIRIQCGPVRKSRCPRRRPVDRCSDAHQRYVLVVQDVAARSARPSCPTVGPNPASHKLLRQGYGSDMAGMVLTNAKVYTSDEQRPSASATLIKDGVVTYVGGDIGALENLDNLPVYDLGGMTIVPGFIDA